MQEISLQERLRNFLYQESTKTTIPANDYVDLDFQLEAVRINPNLITQFTQVADDSVWVTALEKNAHLIRYSGTQTEKQQVTAIMKDVETIEYINVLCEKAALAAIRQDGYYIKYVKNPTYLMQRLAVIHSHNPYCLKNIADPDPRIIDAALLKFGSMDILKILGSNTTVDVQIKAVKLARRHVIKYNIMLGGNYHNWYHTHIDIFANDFGVRRQLVLLDPSLIKHWWNVTEELYEVIAMHNGHNIKHISNPTDNIKAIAAASILRDS